MRVPTRKPTKFTHIKTDPLITEAKMRELQSKLDHLKRVSKPYAMKEVARLAEMGDFSENFGYQAAKGRLRGINNAILKLEYEIDHAQIITPKHSNVIQLGHTVTIRSEEKEQTVQILGSSETNPATGIISHSSPIGAALLGKKVGDTITIPLKNKDISYTIVSIH